jgi:sigma-B regulation protein RsbU (phosphoserine phosphatase)
LEIGERENLENFTIHLYTDGLTESMNPEEEEYGEERFLDYVNCNIESNPEDFHRDFFEKMQAFTQEVPLRDDLTLLSLRFR